MIIQGSLPELEYNVYVHVYDMDSLLPIYPPYPAVISRED